MISERPERNRRLVLALAFSVGIALTGTSLRLMSVHWNQRLQGDVNLFALTARQFYRESRLEYPFKFDYYGGAPYESLRSQASLHPPFFPFLGGMISKITNNADTFIVLKSICFVTGLVVLGLVVALAKFTPASASIPVALALASFMPIMVDYSGNGSPYIMLAGHSRGDNLDPFEIRSRSARSLFTARLPHGPWLYGPFLDHFCSARSSLVLRHSFQITQIQVLVCHCGRCFINTYSYDGMEYILQRYTHLLVRSRGDSRHARRR